ncbi:hypothetical protein ACFY8O_12535 [Streptomyces argenteolus]|uniref:Pyridine nucleotide-disulfide oxidoreductase n=1 Tax=Streptomyces argenteolus TaxID=67274 RepID=A0ABW6X3T3_9ACTN
MIGVRSVRTATLGDRPRFEQRVLLAAGTVGNIDPRTHAPGPAEQCTAYGARVVFAGCAQ